MILVTYCYARIGKADCDDKNLETQLHERVQPGDTIVVVWQDRFSRGFDEGVSIQADLT